MSQRHRRPAESGTPPALDQPDRSTEAHHASVSLLGPDGAKVVHALIQFAMGRDAEPDMAAAFERRAGGGLRVQVDRDTYDLFQGDR